MCSIARNWTEMSSSSLASISSLFLSCASVIYSWSDTIEYLKNKQKYGKIENNFSVTGFGYL